MLNVIKNIFSKEFKLLNQGKCPFCKNIIDEKEFKDTLSRKEFKISGLCQKCQDGFFK